jgi:hypothetical protein
MGNHEPAQAVDLVAVSARDGLAATVVAADGRRFTTTEAVVWQTPGSFAARVSSLFYG